LINHVFISLNIKSLLDQLINYLLLNQIIIHIDNVNKPAQIQK